MIRRTHHHLPEERLLECYRAARAGESIAPPAAEHLVDCAECAAHYAGMTQFMDELRQESEHETDEIFTPDWLRAQHLQIAQRLEHVGRPARVIRFPATTGTPAVSATRSNMSRRWVAAAVAAGLFIGVGLGIFYDTERRPRQVAASAAATAASTGTTSPADAADEEFLLEMELAAAGPYTRALAPFDALTPHIVEAANSFH